MEILVTTDLAHVARDLGLPVEQVKKTVELLDEGNTVPFITRFRKDQTGGFDEEQIRGIQAVVGKARMLAERKQTILKSIDSQGKLTKELAGQIKGAQSTKRLEDLYLPYKPKRRTRAMIARERGLGALADAIRADRTAEPEALAAGYLGEEVPDAKAALAGARDIIVEELAENADLLGRLRGFLQDRALLTARVNEGEEQKGAEFSDYFDHRERWADVPSCPTGSEPPSTAPYENCSNKPEHGPPRSCSKTDRSWNCCEMNCSSRKSSTPSRSAAFSNPLRKPQPRRDCYGRNDHSTGHRSRIGKEEHHCIAEFR